VKVLNGRNISFSQAGEDYNIRNFFREKKNGFYVDIGAFHPFNISNTAYFYLFENWHGINIDARPGNSELFDRHRPRDINLELAVGSANEATTYYLIDDTSSMNSFSKPFLESHEAPSRVAREIPMTFASLEEILDRHLPRGQAIDFLNIDVEGMEIAVLASNACDKYRPTLIVAECAATSIADIDRTEVCRYLAELGYEPMVITYLAPDLRNVIYRDATREYPRQ
jgi:FkbM family methyltransferase